MYDAKRSEDFPFPSISLLPWRSPQEKIVKTEEIQMERRKICIKLASHLMWLLLLVEFSFFVSKSLLVPVFQNAVPFFSMREKKEKIVSERKQTLYQFYFLRMNANGIFLKVEYTSRL